MAGLLDRRLLFVTGKGGVGKTTVATALGLLASSRRRVLVCEVEPKGDVAAAFDGEPAGFVPREVARGLSVMEMDTEASLREYLRLYLRVPMVGRIGPVARAFDFVASAAPGVREILTVGKLCYEVREGHFDLVIVDSAASGHVVGQLAAPVGINDLVKVGAVRSQTRWMLDILQDPAQTGVVVVSTPEEMPVNEAIDLASRLGRETGVSLAGLVANRVLPELFSRGEQEIFDELSAEAGAERLADALGDCSVRPVAEVLEAAALAVRIRRSGAEHLERLRSAVEPEVPFLFVPYLFGRSHGARAVRQVADALGEELGA
jgi:anion-transporting  ArsA/GET3 family ATPase